MKVRSTVLLLCLFMATMQQLPTDILPAAEIPMFMDEISGTLNTLIPTSPYNAADPTKQFDEFSITMEQITQQLLPPGFPSTTIYAYGGMTSSGVVHSYPGPTIPATSGIPTKVKWTNNIVGPHILPVDFSPPFSSAPAFVNEVPTVPHAHGVTTHSGSDGTPKAFWTASGARGPHYISVDPAATNQAVYSYPNEQGAGLFWYHDHTMGITRLNVYAGLAGLYVTKTPTKSAEETNLEFYYGQLEQKLLAIGDKTFRRNGDLFYNDVTPNPNFSTWIPEFFGNTMMVNGKVWPKMTLEKKRVRLVLLNGCNSRYVNMYFDDAGVRVPFDLIRTEGDYLAKPVRVNQFLISPGSRIEIVINLTNVSGDVIMKNDAATPFPLGAPIDAFASTVMKFVMVPAAAPVVNPQEAALANVDVEGILKSVVVKNAIYPANPAGNKVFITMVEVPDDQGAGQVSAIFMDGTSFDQSENCVGYTYKLGATYDFYFINLIPDTHPIHWHLINFQKIMEIPFDVAAYQADWYALNAFNGVATGPSRFGYPRKPRPLNPDTLTKSYYTGPPVMPLAHERSFRDIVDTKPGHITVLRIKFTHNDGRAFSFNAAEGRFVFHCHMLDHEDNDMMKYFCLK